MMTPKYFTILAILTACIAFADEALSLSQFTEDETAGEAAVETVVTDTPAVTTEDAEADEAAPALTQTDADADEAEAETPAVTTATEEDDADDAADDAKEEPETPTTIAAPVATPAPAPAVEEPAIPTIREEGVDEIDLEEIDDAAEAAKVPSIKQIDVNSDFVDISCDEATIADILRQFRKTTNANIINGDSTNLNKRVSVQLKHVQWLDALQSILNSRGFRVEERGNIYFVNEDKIEEPVFTKSFTLNHASPEELAALFNETYAPKNRDGKVEKKLANAFPDANVVVVTANEKVLTECEKIIEAIDKAVAQIYIEARFIEISNIAQHALGLDWSSLNKIGAGVTNLKAGFGAHNGKLAYYGERISSRSSNYTAPKTDIDGEGKSTTAGASTTESSTYEGIGGGISDAAGGNIPASDMSWRAAYGFSGQISATDFGLYLSAFESLGEGKIFSNPKIIVANGKEAKVDMTTKEPNVSVEANYTGSNSQNMNISTRLETIPGKDPNMFADEAFFSYGISLTVKPRISPDGLITVSIVPTISESTRSKTIKGSNETSVYTEYPVIDVKRLETTFTMKDGATAVIGGLTRTVENDVDDGIPYLRDIPWIGQWLFGKKTRQKQQNEIVVFVTVGIAKPDALPEDIGLPTNAVYGREYVTKKRLEPGFREGGANKVTALDKRRLDEQNDAIDNGSVVITPSR